MDVLEMVVALAHERFRFDDRPPRLWFVDWMAERRHTIYENQPYDVWTAYVSTEVVRCYTNAAVDPGWR